MDDYRKRARIAQKEKQERGRFKLPEGDTVIRILKTPEDDENGTPSGFIRYAMHSDVGPEKMFVRCGKDSLGDGECWICDSLIPKLVEKGKGAQASALQSKGMMEVNIAVLDDDSNELRGPLRWFMSDGSQRSLSFKLLALFASPKRDYFDHKNGYNFTITRTGMGRYDTVYTGPIIDSQPTAVPKEILARLKPFSSTVPSYDPEVQKNAYYGKETKTDEEDDMPRKKPKYEEPEEEIEQEEEDVEAAESDDEYGEDESASAEDDDSSEDETGEDESADEEYQEDEDVEEEEPEEEEDEAPPPPKKVVKKPVPAKRVVPKPAPKKPLKKKR